MNEFERLVSRCKGEVELYANPHRNSYQTKREYMTSGGRGWQEHLTPYGDLYALQFYPDTPIGFYVVYANTLPEVVSQAHDILDAEEKETT